MGDPWLRDSDGKWLHAPQNQGVYSLQICDLLSPNSKEWDIVKVSSLFTEQDARRILAVPLLPLVEKDEVIWQGESNGLYTVRSGYRKLMEEKNSVGRPREGDGWKKLWKMQAPPKVKHLMWRVCKDCVPTRTRLRSRNVNCPVECPLCGIGVEDDWHLFVECEGGRAAWVEAGLSSLLPSNAYNNHDICSFIFDTCRKSTTEIMGRLAVLFWCIWLNRNNAVWNSKKLTARQVGTQASYMWKEWAMINGLVSAQHNQDQQQLSFEEERWQKPPVGMIKCNVDASFFAAVPATGWGWCVRDHEGSFILAGSDFLHANLTTLEGEAMALLQAMKFMEQKGYSNVIFESDSKLVVDAIYATSGGISEFSVLISHINSLLLMNSNFEVKFVRRQANMAAHMLARVAYSIASCRVYDSIPLCIATTLNNDMN